MLLAGCVIKAVRETAALMFGVSVASMVGCDLSQFLPNACPSKNATDMLIVGDSTAKKGGMGSKSKKTVGKLMPLVRCRHIICRTALMCLRQMTRMTIALPPVFAGCSIDIGPV